MINKAISTQLLLLAAALAVLPGRSTHAADAQFYKPNREARLVVSLKSKHKYDSKPVKVTVMLNNQSSEPLLINRRMRFNRYPLDGEIAFVIADSKKKALPLLSVVAPRDITDADLTVLKPGETMEQEADLTAMYGLTTRGKYRLQAIYYNALHIEKNGMKAWTGTLAAEPTELILQ